MSIYSNVLAKLWIQFETKYEIKTAFDLYCFENLVSSDLGWRHWSAVLVSNAQVTIPN